MQPFGWELPYGWPRKPVLATQRGVHLATPRRAGRSSDARRRRQRGRRGCGHRDCVDGGGAGVQRHRVGRLRHRVGRAGTARVERVGPLPRGMDAGVFRRQGCSPVRLEFRHGPRCGVGLGRAAREIREASVRPALRAGNRLRPQRLSALPDDRGAVGGPGAAVRVAARIRRDLHARRASAKAGRTGHIARPRHNAGGDCRNQRRGVLPWRAGSQAGSPFDGERRGHAGRRPRRASRRLGRHHRGSIPWIYRARDTAQRPRHRRVDRPRNPGALRHGFAASRFRGQRPSADRGGETRIRRRAGLRLRHRSHVGEPERPARRGLPA